MDSGETHEGLVQDVRYDGSQSFVLVAPPGRPQASERLPLAHITRVTAPAGGPNPGRRDAA